MGKTALVVVLLVGCGGSSKQQPQAPPAATAVEEPAPVDPAQEQARRDHETKAAAANQARAKVDSIEKALLDLTARIDLAIEDLNNAESDGERATKKEALEALRKEKLQLESQITHAKAACDRAERAEHAARSRN